VVAQFQPERIIIEPSGVGKLSDIVVAVEKVKAYVPDLAVTEKITVVDVKKAKLYLKNFGEFFKNQVESASTVVLSRTQLVSDEKLAEAVALIRELNAEAPLVTTPWTELKKEAVLNALENSEIGELDLSLLDEDDDEDEHEHHHHHHDHDHDEDEHEHEHHHHHDHDDHDEDEDEHEHEHHHHHDHDHGHEHHHHHHHKPGEHDADEVFENVGVETARRFTQDEIRGMTDALSDQEEYGLILRAKGILQTPEGAWFQFDYVPGELQLRDCSPDYAGRLVVIGTNIDEKALRELFKL
ncbi:MAG: GTP-binding protein, partial [Clostridia bacterium]|nr:GTP-binding protein [Clostridia bacterium]